MKFYYIATVVLALLCIAIIICCIIAIMFIFSPVFLVLWIFIILLKWLLGTAQEAMKQSDNC